MGIEERLETILAEADDIIVKEVIELARVILRDNHQTYEFIMAMGSFFFTKRGKHNAHENFSTEEEIKALKGGKQLWNFITRWDSQFKVTGTPLRFSLHSAIKTDW